MNKQLMISGVVVNVVKVKARQNNTAWLNVYVDNTENLGVSVACHSLPKHWFDDIEQNPINTGGNEYKNV